MSDPTTDNRRPGTHHPHLARERALKVLFAADVRGVDPRVLLDEVASHAADLELLDELEPDEEQVAGDEDLRVELTRRRRLPLDDYTRELVAGVAARRPAIDEVLGDVADRWPVHRMPTLDRNLLRLAVYELAEQDTPQPVVIDEAVSLAIAFAGEKARGFVNGVLETVRKRVAAGEVALTIATPLAEPVAADAGDPDAGTPGVDADPDSAEPDDLGPHGAATDDDVEDVDEAAQAAYDVALDLLDQEPTTPEDDAHAPDQQPVALAEDDEAPLW